MAEDFHDGAVWVPLAGLRDPSLVVPSIEHALGPGATSPPVTPSSCSTTSSTCSLLRRRLRRCSPRHPTCSGRHQPRPATRGREQEFPLDPLDPQAAGILFVERARQPDARCNRTTPSRDLPPPRQPPAALELAAARAKLLAPQALLAATRPSPPTPDRRPPRRSRAAANPPRHDRVEPRAPRPRGAAALRPPRRLRRQLLARRRRADLRGRPRAHLRTRQQQPAQACRRYRLLMLETVREFALEQSASSGALGHCALATGRSSSPSSGGRASPKQCEQVQWLGRLDADQRISASAVAAVRLGRRRRSGRSVNAAYPFWEMRLYLREADSSLQRAPALGDHYPPTRAAPCSTRQARSMRGTSTARLGSSGAAALFRTVRRPQGGQVPASRPPPMAPRVRRRSA